MANQYYTRSFYAKHLAGMSSSANIILPLVYRYFTPKNILDVGCGQGAWLAAAETLGTSDLSGIDGSWVNTNCFVTNKIKFNAFDLSKGIPSATKKYDLCISLEVAEHLPADKASEFIDFLCASSDLILFSAATKHQGGENHINEQWQSYWVDLFKLRKFNCIDYIRPEIWNNQNVEWWYKQNIFVFVKQESSINSCFSQLPQNNTIYDLIHPTNYEQKYYHHSDAISNPSLSFSAKIVCRTLKSFYKKIGRKVKSFIKK
ncbi:MAG: class I SAM-dependent methyltransferase [Burkholderiaceae bacterium]|jgi:SAM-dependent methyltransferase|nr:class I SAM-dependent methyltransferase [Burkholderiaceae bacterium]